MDLDHSTRKDVVWLCPRCRASMESGVSGPLGTWNCKTCGFAWVSGQALAEFLPTVKAFEEISAAAIAGRPSTTRSLWCPLCHAQSLHLVTIRRTEIDVCTKCVGVALDPGELRTLKSMRHTTAERVVDVISGLDALANLLTLFH